MWMDINGKVQHMLMFFLLKAQGSDITLTKPANTMGFLY